MPPEDIQAWVEQGVLPRKAAWTLPVAKARSDNDDVVDVVRRP
jgi:hypothetical protein